MRSIITNDSPTASWTPRDGNAEQWTTAARHCFPPLQPETIFLKGPKIFCYVQKKLCFRWIFFFIISYSQSKFFFENSTSIFLAWVTYLIGGDRGGHSNFDEKAPTPPFHFSQSYVFVIKKRFWHPFVQNEKKLKRVPPYDPTHQLLLWSQFCQKKFFSAKSCSRQNENN